MTTDLLLKLEQKVANAVEVIELLRMQIEELEEENQALKAEHEKWRNDLSLLIKRFDQIDEKPNHPVGRTSILKRSKMEEEDFMTV